MPTSNKKETIDERILRLIGLKDIFDLDYDTYMTLLKEAMVKGSFGKTRIPDEELALLANERKRVRGKRGRFEVKKKKKISSDSFSVGNVKKKISGKNATQKALPPEKVLGQSPLSKSLEDNISSIASAVSSIYETLKTQKKVLGSSSEYDRKQKEQEKRALAGEKLKKRFEGLKKTAEKIIAPVKSILDRLIDFFVKMLFGHVIYKLIEWLGNPDNANKVKSIIRFLGDHWPKILALYIAFGTSFGKFTRGLVKLVISGSKRLLIAIAKLAAAKGIGGARGAAKFLGGRKGKLLAGALEVGAVVGGTVALSKGLESFEGTDQKSQGYSGGGHVKPRLPGFSGGGLNFKGMMGGASLGAMFGPLGMMLGGALGANKPQQGGFVSGEKGVDKIPAMLSDGEFVMSRGAVEKYGVGTLEAMNAAGGGTNKPKIMSGTTYAAGGGFIGKYRETSDALYSIDKFFQNLFGGNVTLSDPKTWPSSGFFKNGSNVKMPDIGGLSGGSNIRMPNIGGIKIPGEFGGETIKDLGKQISKGGLKISESAGGIKKYIQNTFDKLKSDPRVQNVSKSVGEIQKKLIKNGYLNEEGKLSGAAKNQATNFLSDLLPNLPFVNALNKMQTESHLKSIGISKENAKYGDLAAQAMITGKSGIESAYNIGQMQLNKMSKESKKVYLDILKERMASGTLKSGDVINPYGKVDKSDPRYREQGSVRFHVDPKTGKGYLLDTYGFDPGKVDLGGSGSSAQRQYEEQVKSFQDPNKKIKLGPLDIPIGRIAKKLDLKPMQDATEGGGLPQYILALRNKMFGYDAQKEGAKLDAKRFKSKSQIDELAELGNLKKFAAQLSPEQKKLVDDKLKKEKADQEKKKQIETRNQKALEEKRPWWDKAGWFGGGSKVAQQQAQLAKTQSKKTPVKPPSKPKPQVITTPPARKRNARGGGTVTTPSTPKFSASTHGMRSKQQTLGMLR